MAFSHILLHYLCLFDAASRFDHFFIASYERKPDMPFSFVSEACAGIGKHACSFEQDLIELRAVGVLIWNFRPDEHRRFRCLNIPSGLSELFDKKIPAAFVFLAQSGHEFMRVFECADPGFLDGTECLKIDHVHEFIVAGNEFSVPDHDGQSCAAHRVRFGKGVQFEADFPGSLVG